MTPSGPRRSVIAASATMAAFVLCALAVLALAFLRGDLDKVVPRRATPPPVHT
jgi:hypothetical protein